MSRTFRHIPYWVKTMPPYVRCWIRLGQYSAEAAMHSVRSSLHNGYDNHHGRTSLAANWPSYDWKDTYASGHRRSGAHFVKRRVARGRRRGLKQALLRELQGWE